MPVTEKYAATVASARAATRVKAPLARSDTAGTASGTLGAAETVSGALGDGSHLLQDLEGNLLLTWAPCSLQRVLDGGDGDRTHPGKGVAALLL